MPSYYTENPALKPTVMIHALMKNVYRPSEARELPQNRSEATDDTVARETSRAA
jgi:hypothetical protein